MVHGIKGFLESSVYTKLILALAILLVALVIFAAGIAIGYERANLHTAGTVFTATTFQADSEV